MTDEYPEPPVEPDSLTAAELKRRLDAGEQIRLLDVRDRDEFEQWHIDAPSVTATQLPFPKVLQAKVTGDVDGLLANIAGSGPITVVCAHGEASAFTAGLLTEHGVDARNLADGMDGWAQLYESHEIPCEAATILQYQRPSSGCLAYLIVSDGQAAVVDPLRSFADRYVDDAVAHDATLDYAIDTHVHADHVSGLQQLASDGVEPMLPARAAERGVAFDVTELDDGETITVGEATVRIVTLPGHTAGMCGVLVGDVLCAGDSVFVESVARPDLEADDEGAPDHARELHRTLTERLAAFDDETVLAPGHYSEDAVRAENGTFTARLGTLRERLAAFGMDRDQFVEYVCSAMGPRPANFERIIEINLGTERADADEAFELELGPNNCAATPVEAEE